jgi:thiamine biosynthesis lipoprotein
MALDQATPAGVTTAAGADWTACADWTALGTQVRLVVTDGRLLNAACADLEAELAAVDAACSRFRPDSELVSLDDPRRDETAAVPVSPLLAEAIEVALRAARLTDGDVDPTVGAAMSAVGYDRDFVLVQPTGPRLRLTVRAVPGWRQVRLDRAMGLVALPIGVRLDLGATAKAWAADRAADHLAGHFGCGVLVSLGGDIAVAGEAPAGGWRVRVQDACGRPEDPPVGPSAVVSISSGGLATSSITARRWRRGGDILHHILDPRTGQPARPIWRTASVTAATCADANAASTAAIIKGETAPAWLEGLGLAARLVDAGGGVHTVAGWPPDRQS